MHWYSNLSCGVKDVLKLYMTPLLAHDSKTRPHENRNQASGFNYWNHACLREHPIARKNADFGKAVRKKTFTMQFYSFSPHFLRFYDAVSMSHNTSELRHRDGITFFRRIGSEAQIKRAVLSLYVYFPTFHMQQ